MQVNHKKKSNFLTILFDTADNSKTYFICCNIFQSLVFDFIDLLRTTYLKEWSSNNYDRFSWFLTASTPPPFCWWRNFYSQGEDQKRNECLGGLKVSAKDACGRGAYYVSCQKRHYKMKYGIEGSIFKWQYWPVLVKQPINVYVCDILVLLNHLNNATRN